MSILEECAELPERVRTLRPLVHHLTNYVTVNDCANVTLAIGASPIMATAIEEVGEIAAMSSAVVLNIGTLHSDVVVSMLAAGKAANAAGVPVVLDPVGAGASALRSATTERLLGEVKVTVIRGNISEIRAASGLPAHTKGVDADSGDQNADAGRIAADLAAKMDCTVVVTGAVDAVSDGRSTIFIGNGHPMLSSISGTGCMCTSLAGAFVGAAPKRPLAAAAAAILAMGIAGEIAYAKAGSLGLGSYRQAVMDAVSLMTGQTIFAMGNIRETGH